MSLRENEKRSEWQPRVDFLAGQILVEEARLDPDNQNELFTKVKRLSTFLTNTKASQCYSAVTKTNPQLIIQTLTQVKHQLWHESNLVEARKKLKWAEVPRFTRIL